MKKREDGGEVDIGLVMDSLDHIAMAVHTLRRSVRARELEGATAMWLPAQCLASPGHVHFDIGDPMSSGSCVEIVKLHTVLEDVCALLRAVSLEVEGLDDR